MGDRAVRTIGAPAACSVAWCVLFAALHLYWAAGGTTGLASSAGQQLADRRPPAFVIFGLYGVAILLLVGTALILTITGHIGSGRSPRFVGVMVAAVAAVAAVLLIRAVVLECLLAFDLGGLRTTIGPLETRWSLALWNPWFGLGGGLLMWTAISARRQLARGSQ